MSTKCGWNPRTTLRGRWRSTQKHWTIVLCGVRTSWWWTSPRGTWTLRRRPSLRSTVLFLTRWSTISYWWPSSERCWHAVWTVRGAWPPSKEILWTSSSAPSSTTCSSTITNVREDLGITEYERLVLIIAKQLSVRRSVVSFDQSTLKAWTRSQAFASSTTCGLQFNHFGKRKFWSRIIWSSSWVIKHLPIASYV